jgi:pimeloyl-[acyl-carrier protein] methyl ester esterase
MFNAFFKARPRLRAALFGLAVCTPSLMVGVTAAFAQPATQAPAFVSDRLSVEVVGAGPDVILIPGYSCSREVWRATADRLKATHRVHLVQLAGFAGEAWTHGDGPLLEPAVEALAGYVQSAGLNKPAVIGHSMGGLSALMLAQRHPEAVGRVMAVDNLPFFSALFGPQVTPTTARPFADQAAQGLLSQDEATMRAAQQQGAIGLARDPATRVAMVEWAMASDRRALATAISEVMTTDVRPNLAAMTTPVTALYASDADGGAPAAMADAMWSREYAALPGVKLIRVDGSRHFIMADQPQRFAELVDQFLAD